MSYTTIESIPTLVKEVRGAYNEGITKPLEWRKEQLQGILRFLKEKREAIDEALFKDLGRHKHETYLGEFLPLEAVIKDTIDNLYTWSKPRSVATPLMQMKGLSTSQIVPEPKGVVLVIAPWNYPIQLAVASVATAFGAGNAVILKPSEVSDHSTKLLIQDLPDYLDDRCFKVVSGAVKETTALLRERFDHILYTGNGTVGRIVMRAAAEHLTPVTLELGGKSPVIVDKELDLDVACRRIVWGKYFNAGQSCISCDYILVHKDIEQVLVDKLQATIKDFYGDDPKSSQSFSRVINNRQLKRLVEIFNASKQEDEKIVKVGGDVDESINYFAPTMLHPVKPESPIMQDEIFGPILPILPVDSIDDAIKFVNERPKPLALYIFSRNASVIQNIIDNTSSGGVSVNDVMAHFAVTGLPFGGVGESGIGAYHGITGFNTLSHLKAVLNKSTWFDLAVRYPPYTDSKVYTLERLANF